MMLGVFRNRQSADWHRSVKATAADKHPIAIITVGQLPQPNPNFPWDKLQEHTDAYLRKKKKLTPEQLEERLVNFIRKHADKMDIAIAACGHKMKPETLRGLLLSDLNIGPGKNLSMNSYLQAIIAANKVNPQSVGDVEAQRAHSMIAAATIGSSSPGHYLHALVQILIAGVPPTFLLYTHIHALALKACTDFAIQLQRLKDDGQLRRAYSASSWLSTVSERSFELAPENLGPERLLDTAFPTWKSWASWKPNQERLFRWERFTNQERITLKDLLALEGPDTIGRQGTLREGALSGGLDLSSSLVRVGGFGLEHRLAVNILGTITRLMDSIDAASAAGSNAVALLIHQCVGKVITHDALRLLEVVRSSGDSSVTSLILPVYGANNEPRRVQMTAAMRLLPILARDQSQPLRDIITPHLVALINDGIKDMQANLRAQLESGNALDDSEIKLQGFGKGLLDTPWIMPLLDQNFRTLLNDWPTKDEITSLHKLRISVQSKPTEIKAPLTKKINDFCTDCLIQRGTIDKHTKRLIEALVSVWDEPPNADLHSVAIFVAQGPGFDNKLRCRCLSLLTSLPATFLSGLTLIMKGWDTAPDTACVDLARLIAPIAPSTSDATGYWRLVLYGMIEARGQTLTDYSLNHLKAGEWIKFLSDLRSACGAIEPRNPPPPLMETSLQAWAQRIEKYEATLALMEKDLVGFAPVMKCFLLGSDENDHLDHILEYFTKSYKDIHQPVMLAVVKLMTPDNIPQTSKVLSLLISSTKQGVDASMRILELHTGKTTKLVAEAMLASWLQPSNMGQFDQNSLKALAKMLGMNTGSRNRNSTPITSLEAAADYLDAQFAALFAEAQRLENIRIAFKRVDPAGISKMLSHLKIEDPSPIEDFMAKLPRSLVGVVEMVDDEEVEMQFPLNLTPLQKIGMGVGNAQSLVVRLVLTDYPKAPAFCIHLDNEKKSAASQKGHQPWDPSKNKIVPDQHPCYGRPNRTTYQLARIITRHLHSGFKSLEEIHKLVTTALKDLTTCCLICGTPKTTHLRRSGACQPSCSNVFLRASLEVRLAEIRHDPPVMDLLLTMVHYAAASRKLELLPGCPFSDTLTIANTLAKVPSMAKLTNADDLATAVRKLGAPAEKLLSWTALNYRGFLISASGKTKIPGWPANTHQFLLANGAPDLETAFQKQIGSLPTRVLWHGTSLDRLFAILTQGLKVCSNTPLQAHGAASGPGIYTADNPQTSWGYSTGAGPNWSGSSFSNIRVLLGLEAAGPPVGTGVHVVTNPNTLMVRYVFLIPTGAAIPAATIVAPAMQSVYNSLRAGAL